jgi:voltage-gated potassium channel
MLTQRRVHQILSRAKQGDTASAICDWFIMIMVVLNVIAVILESVQPLYEAYQTAFDRFEYFSLGIFSIEYLLRLWSAASDDESGETALKRRLRYAFGFNGIVDLIAILPSLIELFYPFVDLRSLRAVRLFRIFKFANYSYALEDFALAAKNERGAFFAAFYILLVAVILASTGIYIAENDAQPDKFASIPDAMWWAIITLTTVGYGDVSPVTFIGKIIGAGVAIMGVCVVAMLTGILASSFSAQMARRKTLFEDEMRSAMADGVITKDEERMLEVLRLELNISTEEAKRVRDKLRTTG